jgi:photosystem II stability/assembly factor-like uncharacterized protein
LKGGQLRVVVAVAAAVAVLGGADASPGAGEPWARQSPLPTGFWLAGVDMISTTEAWAVGDVGTILHTTDGGASWQKQASGTQQRLDAVRFKDPLHGWALGTSLALYTVDGGVTWASGTGIVDRPLSVDCSTVTTCFVGYGYSIASKTTDGGRTWNDVTFPFAVGRFQFFDSQKGIASGPGGVLTTNDGGATWSPRPGTHGGFFVNQQVGWSVIGATAEHTTDGGASWQAQTLPPDTWVYASTFVDAKTGWGVGSEENIVHTADGGQTWTTQRGGVGSGARYPFWAVDFVDALHGIVVGGSGKIYTTSDGGAAWTLRTSGAATETWAMDRVGDKLWAVGTHAIVQTSTNGGALWQEEARIPVESGNLPDVDFVDAQTGWTVLDGSAGPGRGRVFKSTDGGRTWQNQGLDDSGRLGGVAALDANVVIAVGVYFPVIMRSADGGQTWQYRNHPFFCTNACGYAWYGIDSPDGQNVWVAGEQGIILHSADRGLTWETQRVGEPWEELMDVAFTDAQSGWAVGWQGTILRTTDGGRTWIKKDPGLGYTGAVLTVCPLSANVAWVGGYDAFAARTTDGGLTWQRERVDTETTWIHSWSACTFIDSENGWFGGYTGIFRRTGAASPPPPPVVKPVLTNLALTPSTVEGGAQASGTVTLDSAAPEGGVDVALATDTPNYSSVPASVTVLPGQTSASFTVQSFPVGANVVATISAVYDGVTKTAQLTIQPAPAATDRVSVTRAEYTVQKRGLRIEATSTSASATLRVYVTSTDALIGTLKKLGGSKHAGQFTWPSNPQSVTVRSTAGGSASATVVAK